MKVGVTYTYLLSGDALTILIKVRVGVTYPNNKKVVDCWGALTQISGGGGGGGIINSEWGSAHYFSKNEGGGHMP